jgi:hypothetical protein
MTQNSRFIAGLVATLSATLGTIACTPLDSTRTTGGVTNDPNYLPLASKTTATTTRTLGGVALKLQTVPTRVTLTTSSGTLDHASGATTLNDGTYTLIDPNGYTANGLLTDGVSTLFSTPAQGFTGNYDYARAYSQTYIISDQPYVATGIYGVVTSEPDMPSTGSAVFNGKAQGSYSKGTSNFDLKNGTSKITADFASGNIDVSVDSYTITNRETGVSSNIGFNSVQISGMRVFGNTFSGGAITTLNNGTLVEIVSENTQQTAIGRFFGLNTAGIPDEVGGIGYLQGSDGTLTTIFLAD